MPVGFNSAARNLFLLGSSGADLVTNFFKRIDQSAGTDGVYLPDEIRYNVPDQKFLLAGTKGATKNKGWLEKRSQNGTADWTVTIQSTNSSTIAGYPTSLKALEIDSNDNLIVCGSTRNDSGNWIPWIAKYTNSGDLTWQSTSNTNTNELLTHTGIAIDSSDNIYACGSISVLGEYRSFIEKIDSTGQYSWGRSSILIGDNVFLSKCSANNRGEVVAVGSIGNKGYVIKVDTSTGNVLWDRTIQSYLPNIFGGYRGCRCQDVYIDDNDQIYIVGNSYTIVGTSNSFIIKYSPEGNIIWQRETPIEENISFINVKSDTETEQTIVFGTYVSSLGDKYGILSKYSKDGSLIWRRTLYTSFDIEFGSPNLDADPSFYYLLFVDEETSTLNDTPSTYTFGKVSSSGNGLGNFEYLDGISTVYYETSNIIDEIGRLSDGSVRQDSSDLITYPFNANKIMFDDLATQVANKKAQIDEINIYSTSSYSITTGYPKISRDEIVYGSNLLLNYDFTNKATYPGTGTSITNLSGSLYTGTINGGAIFNSAGYFNFDGTNDYIEHATNSFPLTGNVSATLECWIYYTTTFNSPYPTEALLAHGNGPTPGDTIALGLFDDHRLGMFFNGGTNIGTLAGAMTSYKNTWCHVIGTKSPGSTGTPGGTQTISLYVNGLQLTLGTWASPITPNVTSRVIRLGRWTNDSAPLYFNGRMGEARIYNRVLTASEVSQNFNATRSKYGV